MGIDRTVASVTRHSSRISSSSGMYCGGTRTPPDGMLLSGGGVDAAEGAPGGGVDAADGTPPLLLVGDVAGAGSGGSAAAAGARPPATALPVIWRVACMSRRTASSHSGRARSKSS